MKNKYLNLMLLSALAFSPVAGLKAASLIGVNYGPSLEANVNAGAGVDVNADQDDTGSTVDSAADAGADIDTGARLNTNQDTNIQGDIMRVRRSDLSNEDNARAIANFRNSFNASSNANVNSNAGEPGIPNTGQSAIENANENAFANANENSILLRAGNVSTQEDLRIFAMAALEDDENLTGMSFANNEVVVRYNADGRFIGFVPVKMEVDVKVDQDGEVEFDYPWYGFLVAKDTSDLEAKIQAEVDAALSAEADGGWTNLDRAQLAASIAGALKAHYEANTATSTDEEV